MNRHWPSLSAVILLALAVPAAAWTPRSAPNAPVQVWSDDDARPYRLVRAETVVDVPILRLLALLQDADIQHLWLPYTQQVEVLQQPAPNQTLVRFQTQARWPFSARDAVTLFTVSEPDPTHIRIDMANRPDAAPATPKVERIRQGEGYWLLTALPDCRTRVRYQAGNTWGGNVPQWLVDRLNLRISREALQQLQQRAPALARELPPPAFLPRIPLHEHCD